MLYIYLKLVITASVLGTITWQYFILFWNTIIQETEDPLLRKLYDKKMKSYNRPQRFTLASEGIDKIRTEFHGFMVRRIHFYKNIGVCILNV